MSAGPFIWKQALFAPEVRVEFVDGNVSIATTALRRDIPLKDAASVFITQMRAPPISHLLSVEIVARNGEAARFYSSGYGFAGFSTDECKRAALSLIAHLQATGAAAEIYRGTRPTRKLKLSMIAVGMAAYLYAAASIWFQSDPEDWKITASTLVFTFVIMSAVFFIQLRDSAIARKVSFDGAIDYLS